MANLDKGKAIMVEEEARSSHAKDDEFEFPAVIKDESPALTPRTSNFTSPPSRAATSTNTSTDSAVSISNPNQEEILITDTPSRVGTSSGARAGASGGVSDGATRGARAVKLPEGRAVGTSRTTGSGGIQLLSGKNQLIATSQRGKGHVRSMYAGISGDRRVLYTGSDSKKIRVWNEGQYFTEMKSSSAPVNAIAQDRQRRIFSAHNDGAIRVWEVHPSRPGVHKHVETLKKVSVKNLVMFWRDVPLTCLCLSDDGAYIYCGSSDGTVKTWRLEDMKLVDSMHAHRIAVNAIETVPGGLVFSCASNGMIKMWRREVHPTGANKVRHSLRVMVVEQSAVHALVYGKSKTNTGAGLLYAGLSDGTVRYWSEFSPTAETKVLEFHTAAVSCLALSSGPYLFSGSRDMKICVWWRGNDGRFHIRLRVLTGHEGPVSCLAVQDDGREDTDEARACILYSGALDRTFKIWRITDPFVGGNMRSRSVP